MYLNEAKDHLKILLKDTTPIFLWGPPGIGKSNIIAQICQEWSIQLIDLRLSQLNPVDLRGLPHFDKDSNSAVWLRPEFLPTSGKGILFLDELNTAPVSVQLVAYQLLLDRKIGNYIFPDGWRVVAAGNREYDSAAVTKLPSPLANRMIHLDIEANISDWKTWANGKIHEMVIAFLNFKPTLLSVVPKEEDKAFPTPRSWSYVSKVINLYSDYVSHLSEQSFTGDTGNKSLDELRQRKLVDMIDPIVCGAVGSGVAKEFLSFMSIYRDMPDVDAILEGRDSTVPTRADVVCALTQSLVVKLKDEYIDNFLSYSMKLPVEYGAMMVKDAARNGWDKKISASGLWKQWANKFAEFIT